MKNTIIKALFISVLINISLLGDSSDIKSKIENTPMMKSIGVKVTKVITHDGIHQFKGVVAGKKAGNLDGFITTDFKTLMMGKAYSTKTGAELIIPFDIDTKVLKQIAAYKTGNGKDEYFVFTDPECPYCQKLEKKIVAVKKNVTVYTILFPLNFHKNAKSMCRYILSRKDNHAKANAMKEIANKSTTYQKEKYSENERAELNKLIKKSLNEVNKIGINSTPTILNAKGARVPLQIIIK